MEADRNRQGGELRGDRPRLRLPGQSERKMDGEARTAAHIAWDGGTGNRAGPGVRTIVAGVVATGSVLR
jgi:hypothetical protein